MTLFTYEVTQRFPKAELYGITSQMRRAAASAAANIAEGSAKRGQAEFRRYLNITLGSLAELSYFAILARDLRLISREEWNRFDKMFDEAGRTTMGLYKAVSNRLTA